LREEVALAFKHLDFGKLNLKQMKMKELKKGQWGFTLIELILVIGLTGIIAAAITMTVFQVFNMDARTRNDMTAVYQVRQAGKLVSEDILEAQSVSVNTTASTGFPVTLTWTEVGGAPKYEVVYKLAGTLAGPQILWREYYINRDTNPDPASITKVAEYIDVTIDPGTGKPKTNCSYAGDVVTFTVTATVGEQSETRVYQVTPRPGT
jgi:prepilin-type N-terminal cleavage/methylation domain-containing protein